MMHTLGDIVGDGGGDGGGDARGALCSRISRISFAWDAEISFSCVMAHSSFAVQQAANMLHASQQKPKFDRSRLLLRIKLNRLALLETMKTCYGPHRLAAIKHPKCPSVAFVYVLCYNPRVVTFVNYSGRLTGSQCTINP
jgi:hypothetical protein